VRKVLSLSLNNCPIAIAGLREIVKSSLSFLKKTDRLALTTAIDEVVTNIIRHGFTDGKGELKIDIYRSPHKVKMVIEDSGRPFDPTQVRPKSYTELIEEEIEGRLGLRLLHQLVDQIHYQFRRGKNRLILEKHL